MDSGMNSGMNNTLWIVAPLDDMAGHWQPWYDKAFGFVINASTAISARFIAATNCGEEGPEVWLDPIQTYCTELKPTALEGVVLSDVRNA